MALDPKDRYQSAGELRKDLRRMAKARPVSRPLLIAAPAVLLAALILTILLPGVSDYIKPAPSPTPEISAPIDLYSLPPAPSAAAPSPAPTPGLTPTPELTPAPEDTPEPTPTPGPTPQPTPKPTSVSDPSPEPAPTPEPPPEGYVSIGGVHVPIGAKQLTLLYEDIGDNLREIAKLTKLETLILLGCGITDISLLAGLQELSVLDLDSNDITDLTPLAGLHKLQVLGLNRNKNLNDIAPLAGLQNLFEVSLLETQITLQQTEELNLPYCGFSGPWMFEPFGE